jgi:hypothetical protein
MAKRRGHGEGTIRHRSDGRWEGQFSAGYESGRRKRVSVYADTKVECAKRLREAITAESQGYTLDGLMTTGDFLDHWLTEVLPDKVRPTTVVNYSQCVGYWIKPYIGHVKLARLRPEKSTAC